MKIKQQQPATELFGCYLKKKRKNNILAIL